MSNQMKVVIVGGGFCGIYAAKQLDKYKGIETILIDETPYFEYYPNLHKVITNKSYLKKLNKSYEKLLKHASIINENVTQITPTYVKTETQIITFDYLIIATGGDYPILLDDTKDTFVLKKGTDAVRIADKFIQSKQLLIVGGGIIGTEITGEIVTKNPEKKVTIVHAHTHLLERTDSDAWQYAERFLRKKGVTFFFSEKVISQKAGIFQTDKNHHIPADLCIWCTGIQSNPSYMQGFEQECFSEQNALVVNEFLQLIGHPDIFVGGDINNVDVEKTAHNAKIQGKNIAKNIHNIHQHKPLKTYKKPHRLLVIGLGDWRGIIYMNRVIVGLMIPGIIKWLVEKLTMIQLKMR